MCADVRAVAAGIYDATGTVAIELIGQWPLDLGAGSHGALEYRVHIFHVQHDAHGRPNA